MMMTVVGYEKELLDHQNVAQKVKKTGDPLPYADKIESVKTIVIQQEIGTQ